MRRAEWDIAQLESTGDLVALRVRLSRGVISWPTTGHERGFSGEILTKCFAGYVVDEGNMSRDKLGKIFASLWTPKVVCGKIRHISPETAPHH